MDEELEARTRAIQKVTDEKVLARWQGKDVEVEFRKALEEWQYPVFPLVNALKFFIEYSGNKDAIALYNRFLDVLREFEKSAQS